MKQYRKNYRLRKRIEDPDWFIKERERLRLFKKNNPSSTYKYGLDMQIAMDVVRIRDKNTCKWQKCGKTHKETQIDVHHIFPRSEYPELSLIIEYMICYCLEHHIKWHESRGDISARLMRGYAKFKYEPTAVTN